MHLNLKAKMIITLIVIIVLPISTLGISSYMKARSVFLADFERENEMIIKHMNDYFLNSFMENMEQSFELWSQKDVISYEQAIKQQNSPLKREWDSFMKANPDLLWIYYGNKEGKYMISPGKPDIPKNYDPRARIWYQEAVKNKGTVIWTSPYRDAMSGEFTVTAAKAIFDKTGKDVRGVLGIDFTLKRFSNAISDINKSFKGSTIIIDNSGIIMNHSDKAQLGRNISNVGWVKKVLASQSGHLIDTLESNSEHGGAAVTEFYINYQTVSKTGWKIITLIPTKSMQQIIEPIKSTTLSVAIISIITACIIGMLLSGYVVRKLKNIINYMEQVEKGNLNIQSYYDGKDEFGILNKKFNSMALNISRMMQEARLQSSIDGLTGLFNHNYIYEKLEEELKRTCRYNGKLSIMMIDVDDFKEINDKYGHQAGDMALKIIADTIRSTLREIDTVGRYGGEEFMAILPESGIEECEIAAERIRNNVDNLVWHYESKHLTVSIGIAEMNEDYDDAVRLVGKADSLLYSAKMNGKNRVEK